jgi:8-amino-7-oxononanoate synthase
VTEPLAWLAEVERERVAAGLRRSTSARGLDDSPVLDLAGNDYLGLARDPRVVEAAVRALREWGAGAPGRGW